MGLSPNKIQPGSFRDLTAVAKFAPSLEGLHGRCAVASPAPGTSEEGMAVYGLLAGAGGFQRSAAGNGGGIERAPQPAASAGDAYAPDVVVDGRRETGQRG
jgi:hypothetical protein